MSKLFDLASSFADAIAGTNQNCYWYGFARLENGQIVAQPETVNPGRCMVPPKIAAAGANIGWTSDHGFALIGADANQKPLAFTDCSGFAAWLITQASAADFAAFQAWEEPYAAAKKFALHSQPWPSAAAYAYAGYVPFSAGNWNVVVNGNQRGDAWSQQVQPGDVLAWDIPEFPGKINDTGHMLIVASTIRPAPGQTYYEVDVIDSSILVHGQDTRPPGTTGVGRGVIFLQNTIVEQTSVWEYSFGTATDCFHIAPHISVLRLLG
ncbi:MAG TPA: hypothetical protein VF432_07955 [Thermoanaerobaculia bacterium]